MAMCSIARAMVVWLALLALFGWPGGDFIGHHQHLQQSSRTSSLLVKRRQASAHTREITTLLEKEYDFFMSYAWGEDGSVHRLVVNVEEALRRKCGFNTFHDDREVLLGEDTEEDLVTPLKQSGAMVAFLTEDYNEDMVHRDNVCFIEMEKAKELGMQIIYVVLDEALKDTRKRKGVLATKKGPDRLYLDWSALDVEEVTEVEQTQEWTDLVCALTKLQSKFQSDRFAQLEARVSYLETIVNDRDDFAASTRQPNLLGGSFGRPAGVQQVHKDFEGKVNILMDRAMHGYEGNTVCASKNKPEDWSWTWKEPKTRAPGGIIAIDFHKPGQTWVFYPVKGKLSLIHGNETFDVSYGQKVVVSSPSPYWVYFYNGTQVAAYWRKS